MSGAASGLAALLARHRWSRAANPTPAWARPPGEGR